MCRMWGHKLWGMWGMWGHKLWRSVLQAQAQAKAQAQAGPLTKCATTSPTGFVVFAGWFEDLRAGKRSISQDSTNCGWSLWTWSMNQDPWSMILRHIFWQSGDENMEQSTKMVWKQQGNQELLKYIQNPDYPMILSCSFFVPLHKLQWSLGLQSFLQLVTMVPSAPRFLWFILVVGCQPLVGQEGGWDCSGQGGKHLEEGEGQGGDAQCAHCTRFFLVYSVNALSVLHQRHVWYQTTSRIT